MLRSILYPLFLFVLSTAVCSASELTLMTDSQLCTKLGIATAHKETSLISRLEEEGARRDKMHLTRIKPSECNKLAVDAVNREMHDELKQQDEKLSVNYKHLEQMRKQTQAKN